MTREVDAPAGSAVLVLGMARSGTSAITRLLTLLGVDLGPQEALLPPIAGENAKGFYEHRPIVKVNKELLERMGGSWSEPPRLARGWQRDTELEDLRKRARELLATDFAGASLWGFKDPRTSLTLPFWEELLGDDVRYVICHRRPLDSARSLERRNGIRLDEGVALWTRYMASALAHTAGRRRIIVGYGELFSDREALMEELADFLGVGDAATEQVRAQARAWIDGDLRHHASTLRELVEHPAVSSQAQALHLLLELAIAGRGEADGAGALNDALDGMARELLRREPVRGWPPPGLPPSLASEPPGLAEEPLSLADEQANLAEEPLSLADEQASLAEEPPGADADSDSGLPQTSQPHLATFMPGESDIEASIVVVAGDDPWGAMACLESIGDLERGSPRHEVVLVDNASLGLRSTIAALEGDVRIVRLPERLGESQALHAGVRAARGELVLCLPAPGLLAENALSALWAEPAHRGTVIATAPYVSPTPAPLCRRGPGTEEIEVSVVLPTLNAASTEVRDCLRALQATIRAPHEIVVVDNGAPPQGFTAPVNAALRAARGKYLVVVNDDVRVLDGWWEPLAEALAGGAPLVFPLTIEGRMRWEFAAWCFAMRRELLESMAARPGELFDPSMLVWCQDLDLRKRMAAAGMAPLCVPESHIRHAGSRTVGVTAPHNALRNWIHAQAGRDTEAFRARYPEEASAREDVRERDGLPAALPVLSAEHVETTLAREPIVLRAEGPAWRGHTLDWPAGAGHFFLAGDIEVQAGDSVQDILLRVIFGGGPSGGGGAPSDGGGAAGGRAAGEGEAEVDEDGGGEEELFWIDLVPGVITTGRRSFSLPRESARAIPRGADAPPAEWSQVRSMHICARSRLRGALRRGPSADGATVATIGNLRVLALPAEPSAVLPAEPSAELSAEAPG
jgi:glycosyltransferase involved in cell wall biosynthesis